MNARLLVSGSGGYGLQKIIGKYNETYMPPEHPALAVEIPARVKNRLNLDDASSWVVLSEWNEFVWPGPDFW